MVFAVPPEQLPEAVQFFSELGFRFQTIELEDVGLRVLLDWDGGLELVTPLSSGADGAGAVAQFLQRNGPGVYSVVIRVGDAPAAEQVAKRYGAQTRFHQHRGGDGFELDEIETVGARTPADVPVHRSAVSRLSRRATRYRR